MGPINTSNMHVQHPGTVGKLLKRKHTNKPVISVNKVLWHFCDTSQVLASFTATITIFFSVLFTVGAFRDPLHQNWFLITAVTRFVDHIICLLTTSISHIYPSFQPCFAVNKQIGLRSGEIASARYSKTNLADKVDLEHLSMTTMKIVSNNNSQNNVTASPSDKDQEDLTFLIIKSSGEGLSLKTWPRSPVSWNCIISRSFSTYFPDVSDSICCLLVLIPETCDVNMIKHKNPKWMGWDGSWPAVLQQRPSTKYLITSVSLLRLLWNELRCTFFFSLFPLILEASPWRRRRWPRCHFSPRE